MNIRPKFPPHQQMTIDEFLAFTETRPQEERWELIEGVPALNPSPIDFHQIVDSNIVTQLMLHKERSGAAWLPMLGIGTRVPVSPNSLPQPDVFVMAGTPMGLPVTDDALVIFEVLSKSNHKADRDWRRKVYASVPNCQHYVTVSLKTIAVSAFDRASAWRERRLLGLGDTLDLAALDLVLPLRAIYRWTPANDRLPLQPFGPCRGAIPWQYLQG